MTKIFQRTGARTTLTALDNISLEVAPKEFLVLLGPSGCGKSTLLRCLAGLESADVGTIRMKGDAVYDRASGLNVPPNKRDLNMMFQSYALWPHMTLEDNVAYPLRQQGQKRNESRRRANEYLDLVGLGGLGQQYAGNISGGQQQRAALARTLISEPSLVLFDEPLSNVDAKVRSQLRAEIRRLHRELGFAAVYVTHDQTEAMSLGTRVAVMNAGRIDQIAPPSEVYESPSGRFVAEFVGVVNCISGELRALPTGELQLVSDLGALEISAAADHIAADGSSATAFVRPERIRITDMAAEPGYSGLNTWPATVESVEYVGAYTEYRCSLPTGQVWTVWDWVASGMLAVGDDVVLSVSADSVRLLSPDGE